MTVTRRCFVSGRVQGVFYRASTARKARELALDGWARNLSDGRVEVLVRGDADAVDALCAWLWEGSVASSVSGVDVSDDDEPVRPGFFTG